MVIAIIIGIIVGIGLIAAIITQLVPGLKNDKKETKKEIAKENVDSVIVTVDKDELEEERRQEALACGDTRKVNGDDYFDYVDDWLNKYFCSPFSHANEGYSGYKMGHLNPEEEKRFGTIQLLKVDKFDGSRKIDEVLSLIHI